MINQEVNIDIDVNDNGTVQQASQDFDQLTQSIEATSEATDDFSKAQTKTADASKKAKLEVDGVFKGSKALVSGFKAAIGAMSLFGTQSEELNNTLLKVQGVMSLSKGLVGFKKFLPEVQNLAKGFKSTLTKSVQGFSKASKIALASTGIGTLIVAVGLLIEYWDDLADSAEGLEETQKALNDAQETYNKSVAETTKQVNEVGLAFDLAKDGVISKEEALHQYNETLGDSLGVANSIEEAEANYVSKTEAYIQATAKRALANALLEKAAQAQADAITAQNEKQLSSTENIVLSGQKLMGKLVDDVTGGYFKQEQAANNLEKNLDKTRAAKIKKDKEALSVNLKNEAEALIKSANELEKANGIKSKSNKAFQDKQKEAQKKEIANLDAALKKKGELEQKYYQDRLARIKQQNNEELSEYEKLNQLLLSIEVEKLNAKGQNLDADILQLEDKYKKELELAKGNAQKIFFIEQRRLIELEQLRKKYDDQTDKNIQSVFENRQAQNNSRKAVELRREELFQQKLADSYNSINNLANTAQAFVTNASNQLNEDFQNRIDHLKELGYTEEQIAKMRDSELQNIDKRAKKAFQLEKALRYTQTLLSTIEGVQNAFTTANKSPLTAVFPAYPYVQAGAAAAFGVAQLQQISQSQYKSKMKPSTQGGSSASPGVPQLNAPRLGGQLNADNELTQMRKVYVVESDITSTQAKVSNTQKVSLVE